MEGAPHSQKTVIIKHAGLRSIGAFAAFPTKIIRNASLSMGARLTYGLLLSYAWQEDFCFPAQEQLAKDLGVSDRHVRRFLIELRGKGLITWKQQGLNRPNIYYILEIDTEKTGAQPPTEPQDADRTQMSRPGRTPIAVQERTRRSDYKHSTKNNQLVVNDVTANDPIIGNRSGRGRKTPVISERGLRTKYGLDDTQIDRVARLVDRQTEILGAADRNHAHYVKRAAEAVRDGRGDTLDRTLGEFKHAAKETLVGSRPGYFHAMYTEALQELGDSQSRSGSLGSNPDRSAVVRPMTVSDDSNDTRSRLIRDAERRGFDVPDHVRSADTTAVSRWWTSLAAN